MKAYNTILANISNDKEIIKNLSDLPKCKERFIADAIDYTKAIKSGRMVCVIKNVSASGMSRQISFSSCEWYTYLNSYGQRNYNAFFVALGYTPVKNTGYFRINGCGMDMVFNTNYNIIHKLHRLGFISKSQCNKLAQNTPSVI